MAILEETYGQAVADAEHRNKDKVLTRAWPATQKASRDSSSSSSSYSSIEDEEEDEDESAA